MTDAVGSYTLLEPLGDTALGAAYRARDGRTGRTVALRFVRSEIADDADARRRLIEGVSAAARLSHPAIAATYEVGDHGGDLYVVQEFVQGQPLAQLVADGPLHVRRALEYLIEIADGLADAHASGIEHGYLTAQHARITTKGRVKLLDFGCAEWTGAESSTIARRDLEALAALFDDLLQPSRGARTGETPHGAVRAAALRTAEALRLGTIDSAALAAAALRTIVDTLDSTAPPPAVQPASSPSRRMWVLVAALLVAAGGVLLWLASR